MKKVFAPKCLRGRPYYVTHDKFVRPCCYFVDHGWEPNAPKDESPKGEKLWPIHDVKWLRDPKTNLKNYKHIDDVFKTKLYRDFYDSLLDAVDTGHIDNLPKRCINKCYTNNPQSLSSQDKTNISGKDITPRSWDLRNPYDNDQFVGSRKIQLDLTHRCRLGCPTCMRFILDGPNKGERRQVVNDEFTVEDIAKIVGDGTKYRSYNFCGSIGDAIYTPQFMEIVKYIIDNSKDPKLSIVIHTNGSGKKAEWWKELYSLLRPKHDQVIFGVDGLEDTAPLYRKFINFNESFEAMKMGAEFGFKNNQWQYIVFKFNQHQVYEAEALAKKTGIDFLVVKSDRFKKDDPHMPDKKWLPEDFVKRMEL